jgi:hypothetical protein
VGTTGTDPASVNTAISTHTDPILAEHAAEIRRLGKRVTEDIVEIGRHLAEAEEHVGHGNRGAFLAWIEAEFGWSDQSARRFIHVYKRSHDPEFNKLLNSGLPISALYELAAPNTPPQARTEIVDRIEAGENLGVADVQAVTRRAKGKKTIRAPRSQTGTRDRNADDAEKSAEARKALYAAEDEHQHAETTTPVPAATSKNTETELLDVWCEATEEERQLVRDQVLAEFFGQATGVDIYDHIPESRRKDMVAAFLDRLTVETMLAMMSANFGRVLREHLPAPKRKSKRFQKIPMQKTTDASGNPVFTRQTRGDQSRH